MNQRNLLANTIHHFFGIGENILHIISWTQATHPRVKDLNGLDTCSYLRVEIPDEHFGNFLHEYIPCGVVLIHHALGEDIVSRMASFNKVARKSEWSATKPDQGNFSFYLLSYDLDRLQEERNILLWLNDS